MPLLEKAGYSVCPVLLKSPGMAPAAFDFSCDVDAIRSSVEAVLECGKDAVVVMHSYAAIAGCEALKTFHAEMKGYAHGGDGGDGWVTSDSSAVKKDLDTKHAHRGDGDSDAVVPAKYISRRGRIVYLAFIVGMVMPVGKGLWTPERTEWDGFELKVMDAILCCFLYFISFIALPIHPFMHMSPFHTHTQSPHISHP